MKKMALGGLIFLGLLTKSAFAVEEPRVGIGVTGGVVGTSGNLGGKKGVIQGIDVLTGQLESGRFHSFFNLPIRTTRLDYEGDKLPFDQGKLIISSFGILPTVCYRMVFSISGCLSAGVQQMEARDKEGNNHQSYGSIVFQSRLGKFVGNGFIGGLTVDYTKWEQKVAGNESWAEMVPVTLMIGYAWTP